MHGSNATPKCRIQMEKAMPLQATVALDATTENVSPGPTSGTTLLTNVGNAKGVFFEVRRVNGRL